MYEALTSDIHVTDTLTTVAFGDVPSTATPDFSDIEWGVTDKSGVSLDLNVVATLSVVVTFMSNGVPFGTLSGLNVTLPVGAGLL